MANLTIFSTSGSTGTVTVNYGVYGGTPTNIYIEGTFPKRYLQQVELDDDLSHVRMKFVDGSFSYLSWNDPGVDYSQPVDGFILVVVDAVNGVAPTDNTELFNMITGLLN